MFKDVDDDEMPFNIEEEEKEDPYLPKPVKQQQEESSDDASSEDMDDFLVKKAVPTHAYIYTYFLILVN